MTILTSPKLLPQPFFVKEKLDISGSILTLNFAIHAI